VKTSDVRNVDFHKPTRLQYTSKFLECMPWGMSKVLNALTAGNRVEIVIRVREGIHLGIGNGKRDFLVLVDIREFMGVIYDINPVAFVAQLAQHGEHHASGTTNVQHSVPVLKGMDNIGISVHAHVKNLNLVFPVKVDQSARAENSDKFLFDLILGHEAVRQTGRRLLMHA